MPRVISLLRVSTDAQDLMRQRSDIARLERRFKLQTVRTLELSGVSGTAVLNNGQIQQVLRDLARPEVDGIAVSALDRLFRPKKFGDFSIFDPFRDSRKLIWSIREGEIDPSSDEGFSACVHAGERAGSEWRELRRRSMDGKEEKRRLGRHVQGPVALPRGVAFDKATGAWSYIEPDASRVARMFELFLEGYSLHAIADAVGGGWSFQGVRRTLRNRIWGYGERTYKADSRREQPLVVQVIDKPLIAPEVFERVQGILDGREHHWRQSRRPTRFLLAGLLKCSCGKPCYLRTRSRNSSHDTYVCASRHPSGPGCGMRRVWRESVDEAVVRLIQDCFRSPERLLPMLEAIRLRSIEAAGTAPPPEPVAQSRARLEAKRERILEQRADGLISREQCNERVAVIDDALAELARPVEPRPEIPPAIVIQALRNIFQGFEGYTSEQQRSILRSVLAEIVLSGNAIVSVTFNGVKLNSRSRSRCWRRCTKPA
jgi:DNA invertase Pin-like site-specific DNA recombinase